MATSPEDLRSDLGFLRDNLIEAIAGNRTSAFNDGLEIYQILVSSFTEKMAAWRSTYDRKRAMQEMSSINGEWLEIRWINEDFREIIDAGLAKGNFDIVRALFLNLYRCTTTAFASRDYYIFYRFMTWFPYFYGALQREKPLQNKEAIFDYCWRLPTEIGNLFIFPEFEKARTTEELSSVKEFAGGVISVFNQLLKIAFDAKKLEDFRSLVGQLQTLFQRYGYLRDQFQHQLISAKLRRAVRGLTADQLQAAERDLCAATDRIHQIDELDNLKQLVFFGFGAWFYRNFESGMLTTSKLKEWVTTLPAPADLERAWQLYLSASNEQTKFDLQWEWWDVAQRPEGFGPWMGIEKDLQTFFLATSLQAVANLSSQQVQAITIPSASELRWLADSDTSPLLQGLTRMQTEADKWTAALGEQTFAAIPNLKALLRYVALEQKRIEKDRLIAEPLSAPGIEVFRRSIIRGWKENATLRKLIEESGNFETGSPSAKTRFFGINVRDHKEFYVRGDSSELDKIGHEYGSGIARGEDAFILRKLLDSVSPTGARTLSMSELLELTKRHVSELASSGYNPTIIILNIWDPSELVGELKGHKVIPLRFEGGPHALIVDFKKSGRLKQSTPARSFDEEVPLPPYFLFMLKPISHEEAAKMAPRDAAEQPNPDGLEDTIREFQLQVHLRVVEQFDFEITDGRAIRAVTLDDKFNTRRFS